MSLSRHITHFEPEKKTVMICDDDRDMHQLFAEVLKSKYNIILVGSGERRPHIIIDSLMINPKKI